MASFNRVILMGNLTRDPEMRHTSSGTPVTNFRLAVSETYRSRQDGQTREVVCYVDVAAWDRQAETCNQYLSKGSPVLVEGRLIYDEWKNQQGETRNRLSVRADRVQFLYSGPRREDSAAGGGGSPAGAAGDKDADAVEPPLMEPDGGDDEDLPF